MRKQPKTETELVGLVVEELSRRLPRSWSIELDREPLLNGGLRPDGVMRVRAPDGTRGAAVLESRLRLDPRMVDQAVGQLRRYREIVTEPAAGLIAASFLSPRTREALVSAGVGYVDATGNLRFELERPGLFIEAQGAGKNPWPPERPYRSIKGPSAGRLVRALLDFEPPFSVTLLAELAGVSPASASRVLELLDREALVNRGGRGRAVVVTVVDRPGLVRRWTEDYGFASSNSVRAFLEPRGLPALLDKLRSFPGRYAVTGSLAAAGIAPAAPARLASLFVDDTFEAARTLALAEAEAGTNVMVAEPFDPVVFERSWERDGVQYAAPSQTIADLLTSPGRGPAEAEELIAALGRSDARWRD